MRNIDQRTLVLTSERLIFVGMQQTKSASLDKVLDGS
jgi:hypothetical protein